MLCVAEFDYGSGHVQNRLARDAAASMCPIVAGRVESLLLRPFRYHGLKALQRQFPANLLSASY